MAENQLSETSTVTVHDVDCGPVVVRIRTPSLTTPSDECSGLGAALPTAGDLYGEVVSRLDKPVDIRSKYVLRIITPSYSIVLLSMVALLTISLTPLPEPEYLSLSL